MCNPHPPFDGHYDLGSESTTRIPPELIYLIIKQHLHSDETALKALSLSCRALHEYCAMFLFGTVEINATRPLKSTNSDDVEFEGAQVVVPPISLVERFASLLKGSPHISGFIAHLNIRFLPTTPSEEEAFCYILSQSMPKLHLIIFSESEVVDLRPTFSKLSPMTQKAIRRVLTLEGLTQVIFALFTFPISLLSHCFSAESVILAGDFYHEESSGTIQNTELVIAHNDRQVLQEGICKPSKLTFFCITNPAPLDFLSGVNSSISERQFDPRGIQDLNLGRLMGPYTIHHYHLVKSCANSLVTLGLRATNWNLAVTLDLECLPHLRILALTFEGVEPEVVDFLNWLADSLPRIDRLAIASSSQTPPPPTKLGSLELVQLTFSGGFCNVSYDNSPKDPVVLLETHKWLWKAVTNEYYERNRWPEMKIIEGLLKVYSETSKMIPTYLGELKESCEKKGEVSAPERVVVGQSLALTLV